MSVDDGHVRVTYNDIHQLIGASASKIKNEFAPDLLVAIASGGMLPARILRSFLKTADCKNIPIQTIGLALYEDFGGAIGIETTEEKIGKEVVRTQWLDFSTLGRTPLVGRRILIVDEVDDTRTTLSYAVAELEKDVAEQFAKLSSEEQAKTAKTEFAIFVVHNKVKDKAASIPEDRIKYYSGADIQDRWVDYPWEQQDILEHDRLAAEAKRLGIQ